MFSIFTAFAYLFLNTITPLTRILDFVLELLLLFVKPLKLEIRSRRSTKQWHVPFLSPVFGIDLTLVCLFDCLFV